MLSVIVQSESGENSPEGSSVQLHLPVEKPDLPLPSRGHAEGSGLPLTPHRERHLSFHRSHTSHTSHSEFIPPGPSAVPSPNRNPRITLPQLGSQASVVRQPTNRSSHALPSPVAETGTLNSGRPKRIRPPLITRQSTNTNTSHSHVRQSVPPSPAVSPSSVTGRVMKGFAQLMDPLKRHPTSSLSLQALFPLLSSHELAFFSALDSEREEMKARTKSLEAQLRELNEHRKLFDAAHPAISRSWTAFLKPFTPFRRQLSFRATHMENSADIPEDSTAVDLESSGIKKEGDRIEITPMPDHLDPKAYLAARRKLKKACWNTIAILNIYGVRRVLNKFEKATKIHAQRAYMAEKVEKCAFFSDETRVMMDDIQNTFAASFAQGDKKKAITRLRSGPNTNPIITVPSAADWPSALRWLHWVWASRTPSRYWLIRNVGKMLKSGMKRVESCIPPVKHYSHRNMWEYIEAVAFGLHFSRAAVPCAFNPEFQTLCGFQAAYASHQCRKIWSRHRQLSLLFHLETPGWALRHRFRILVSVQSFYTTYALIWLYYVAIVRAATNTLIRYLWVFYIPINGPDFMLRSFILGLLEIGRRWQWNFYRLENEHLGNVDQYRVTREVPLPYTLPFEMRDDVEEEIPERAHGR
ncbi:hypothetical protein B0H12DRAFT_1065762 [Mycena haematopus]|nr:hypothetical protein B0H12DRAFT_1065762 [Mycena haematopus]